MTVNPNQVDFKIANNTSLDVRYYDGERIVDTVTVFVCQSMARYIYALGKSTVTPCGHCYVTVLVMQTLKPQLSKHWH